MNEVTRIPFDWFLLIPILGIVGATICGSLALQARYKQRMLILKTGIKPEEKPYTYKRDCLLIGGASLIAIGGGLLLGLRTNNIALTIAFVFFFLGIALTLAARFVIKESTLSSQQITQGRETMRALVKQLKSFKDADDKVVITLIVGSPLTGEIQEIRDDELLKFKEDTQQEFTYISIDKIISIRKA